MIGEKEQSILDTDKVYIPLIEFNSLYLTIGKSFDNYCIMSQQVTLLDHLKKFNDIFEDKINNISSKIDNIQIDTTSGKNISSEDIKKDIFENVSLDDSTENESTVDVNDKVDKTEQNDFDTFLTQNRDGFELDLPKEDPKTQKEISRQNFFTEKLLKNDFSNLDMIVNNCVNSKLPLDSFVKTVYSLSGVDLYEGISNSDKYCLNYVVTNNLRQSINSYIQKRMDLPKSINPIIINDNICNQDKIDCVCFLLLSYIFLSKIKNDCVNIDDSYANKNYISYCLKTITSPFVFTHILDINKDVLINCIVRLYVELKDKKFYDKYLSDIFNKTHVNVDFNVTYLKDQIEKIYDNIQKFKDKLVVKNFFRKWMKLQYPDFDKFNIDYDSEIMECVLDIENNKNVSSTNKIPIEILNKFGIKDVKFNNEILIRYIKSKCKDFGDLEQIKNK